MIKTTYLFNRDQYRHLRASASNFNQFPSESMNTNELNLSLILLCNNSGGWDLLL